MKKKLKVGDKVKHLFGHGKIIAISCNDNYLVQFKNFKCGHAGEGIAIKKGSLPKRKVNNCWWCAEWELDLLTEKKMQLTLDNGKYGVVGTKTSLVDLYGKKLCVGDTVELFDRDSGEWGEYPICKNETYGDFVGSIASCSKSIKNGISKEGWVIVKKRSYKDFKAGYKVSFCDYTLTEVKE